MSCNSWDDEWAVTGVSLVTPVVWCLQPQQNQQCVPSTAPSTTPSTAPSTTPSTAPSTAPDCWPGNNNCGFGYNLNGDPNPVTGPQAPSGPTPSDDLGCWTGNDNCGYGYDLDGNPNPVPGAPAEDLGCWSGNNNCGWGYDLNGDPNPPGENLNSAPTPPDEDGFYPVAPNQKVSCRTGYGTLGKLEVPVGYYVNNDWTLIRSPSKRQIYTIEQFCKERQQDIEPFWECEKSGTPMLFNGEALAALIQEAMAAAGGVADNAYWQLLGTHVNLYQLTSTVLGEFALPEIPGPDSVVCASDKKKAIAAVYDFLSGVAEHGVAGEVVQEFESLIPNNVYQILNGAASVAAVIDPVTDIATWGLAAMQIGQLNFDESVFNVLRSIPGFGDPLVFALRMIPGLNGFVGRLDELSDDNKKMVRTAILQALNQAGTAAAARFPQVTAVCVFTQLMINFAAEQWDEALMALLGLLKIQAIKGPIVSVLVEVFKQIKKLLV